MKKQHPHRAYLERRRLLAGDFERRLEDNEYFELFEEDERTTTQTRPRTTSTPGTPRSESSREDPLMSAFLMMVGAVGGESLERLEDSQCERGHHAVSAHGQLPIQGSPGYRDRGYRGMEPVVLEGAEDRLAILKRWLAHPDLPKEDLGRVKYQIEVLTEDIERARVWRAMGFEFGAPVDKLFRQVRFPQGWKRQSTDHAMYSDFVDTAGRKRIQMFHKSSFCDRDAFMHYVRRFTVARDYSNRDVIRTRVLDCGKEIFSSEPTPLQEPKVHTPDHVTRRESLEARQHALCCAWLDEHYPNHNDPAAYWDDAPELPAGP